MTVKRWLLYLVTNMKASNLSRKELEKRIRRSRKQLKGEAVKIREMLGAYGQEGAKAPLVAIERFESLNVPHRFREGGKELYTDKEVRDMYRDLEYIKTLKSSTLEGAMETMDNFSEISSYLSSKSEAVQDEFWEIYDKLYETLRDKYKYEIMEIVADMQDKGMTRDEIVEAVTDPYHQILLEYGKDISDEKFELLYSDELRELREGFNIFDPWG